MTRLGSAQCCILLLFACIGLNGCFPSTGGSFDEQRDPNLLSGLSRKRGMNYPGAAAAFEKALEDNPRSASAHLEMALLCYENLGDFAAAIYHFEKYLKLNPKSNRTDSVRQYITYCKQELIRGLPMASVNQQLQRELEKMDKLMRENIELHQQVDQLKAQANPRSFVSATGPTAADDPSPVTLAQPSPNRAPVESAVPVAIREASRPVAGSKTHVVRSGESPYSIARSYGVPVASLLSANPGVDPRRLRPGQPLSIPRR